MEDSKMKNYRILNSCANCKHCFVWSEWDDGCMYYCNITKDRPQCGSTFMQEAFLYDYKTDKYIFDKDNKKFMKALHTWEEWANKHEVSAHGICDEWKLEKKSGEQHD